MIWLTAITWGLLIGAVIGLLGGGGALVSVPVMLYVFHFPFQVAVGASLLLVLVGALPSLMLYWRKRQVDWQSAFCMGISGSFGATLGSQFSAQVPQNILFNVLIALILISIWRLVQPGALPSMTASPADKPALRQTVPLVATGFGIGILTGLVGVGGGFLIVPALMMVRHLEPRRAIATSLVVISLNAASGVLGYWEQLPLRQPMVASLIMATLAGSLLGFQLSFKISQTRLKQGFGLLLLMIATLLFFNPPMR